MACLGLIVLGANLYSSILSGVPELGKLSLNAVIIFGGIATLLQMIGHWLRAVKHRLLLEQIRPIKTADVFKGQIIGLLFNTILPFRMGEVIRAHYIGKRVSVSRAAVFATIVFERWLDATILATVGIMVLSIFMNATLIYIIMSLMAVIAVLGYLLHAAYLQKPWLLRAIFRTSQLFSKRIRDRFRLVCWSGIYGLINTLQRANITKYVVLSLVMWLLYGLSAYVLIAGLLSTIPVAQQLLASLAAYLGVTAPTGPAYIGSFHDIFTAVSGLQSYSVALGLWLLLVAPTSVLGIVFLLQRQRMSTSKEASVLATLKNKLYRDADITQEFSHFLSAYFRGDKISHILNSQEIAKSFQVIKTFKGGSNALTFLAWQDDKMIVKKITLKQYEDKLRAQYSWFKEYEKLTRIAKVLREHSEPDYYALDIDYRENYVPFFDTIHSSSTAESSAILIDICEYVDKRIHTSKTPLKDSRKILRKYISTKVIGKISDSAKANVDIAHLLGYDTITVNGRTFDNFDRVLEKITTHPQAMADLQEVVDCSIHGDLTVDNILVDPATGKYLLIDPNNENSISDPIVDYSKITQSLHSGYEFLYYLNSCEVKDSSVTFEERRSVQYSRLYKVLSKHLSEKLTTGRYRAILFHEAVHYCRMLTYRTGINPRSAAAFYSVAIRLFNNFIEQYDELPKS